jgi:hypothetical protein
LKRLQEKEQKTELKNKIEDLEKKLAQEKNNWKRKSEKFINN